MTPEPLTPTDSDLRDFQFMPLDVVRFAQSDLVALEDPPAILAALLLWGVSWHAQPAGSLTDDDRLLCQAAGYGRAVDEWLKIKPGALRGWVKCSDGRLYHPVVAEKVVEAWDGKLRQRHRTYCAAVRQHNARDAEKADQRTSPSFAEWLDLGRPQKLVTHTGAAMSRVTNGNITRDEEAENPLCHAYLPIQGTGTGTGTGILEEGTSSLLPPPAAPSSVVEVIADPKPRKPRRSRLEPTPGELALFEQFWAAYPKKAARADALEAYLAVIRADRPGDTPEVLLAGAEAYAAVRAGQDPSKTKYAQGWLNGRRWEDDHSDFHRAANENRPGGRQGWSALDMAAEAMTWEDQPERGDAA